MFIYFSVRLIDGGCALRAEVKTPSIRKNATIDTLEPGAPYKLKILRIVHVLLALSLLYFFLLFDSLHLFTDCLFSFFHIFFREHLLFVYFELFWLLFREASYGLRQNA